MKRITITLEFNDADSEYVDQHSGGVDIGLLLRDALGEFVSARVPEVDYINRRYDGRGVGFLKTKLREVEKRNAMAQTLRRADVTILVGAEELAVRTCIYCLKPAESPVLPVCLFCDIERIQKGYTAADVKKHAKGPHIPLNARSSK